MISMGSSQAFTELMHFADGPSLTKGQAGYLRRICRETQNIHLHIVDSEVLGFEYN